METRQVLFGDKYYLSDELYAISALPKMQFMSLLRTKQDHCSKTVAER